MPYQCPVCAAACDKRCKGCLSVAYCSVEHQVGRVRACGRVGVRACGRAGVRACGCSRYRTHARAARTRPPARPPAARPHAPTPVQREDWKQHKGVCKALAAAAAAAAPAEHGPEESEEFEAPARTAVSARALFDVDVDVPAINRWRGHAAAGGCVCARRTRALTDAARLPACSPRTRASACRAAPPRRPLS